MSNLDHELAVFIRRKRGNRTYAEFANIVGVTPSTVFRLEQQQQSCTLRSLRKILGRLECSYRDVFAAD
ncbi:MAG: helix-turn-helix domain-containing protein [Verrucomicrobiales bacterium]|jgi:transcriptional regulator with XRE-family HTH domain|nr:helix-turn-helix domain-containing protein [Verrucomicrobiales bacterium]